MRTWPPSPPANHVASNIKSKISFSIPTLGPSVRLSQFLSLDDVPRNDDGVLPVLLHLQKSNFLCPFFIILIAEITGIYRFDYDILLPRWSFSSFRVSSLSIMSNSSTPSEKNPILKNVSFSKVFVPSNISNWGTDRSPPLSINAVMVFLCMMCTDPLMESRGTKPNSRADDSSSRFPVFHLIATTEGKYHAASGWPCPFLYSYDSILQSINQNEILFIRFYCCRLPDGFRRRYHDGVWGNKNGVVAKES